MTADRPSAAARWDWREFYRTEPQPTAASRRTAPEFTIASSLGGQLLAWDVDYAKARLEKVAELRRFRARFWQVTLPALGLFWAGVIWALVG